MRNFFYSSFGHKILSELKNVLIENNYKTIYEPVRIDRSSYRCCGMGWWVQGVYGMGSMGWEFRGGKARSMDSVDRSSSALVQMSLPNVPNLKKPKSLMEIYCLGSILRQDISLGKKRLDLQKLIVFCTIDSILYHFSIFFFGVSSWVDMWHIYNSFETWFTISCVSMHCIKKWVIVGTDLGLLVGEGTPTDDIAKIIHNKNIWFSRRLSVCLCVCPNTTITAIFTKLTLDAWY